MIPRLATGHPPLPPSVFDRREGGGGGSLELILRPLQPPAPKTCSGFPESLRLLAAALQESESIELRRRIGSATELAVYETQLVIR